MFKGRCGASFFVIETSHDPNYISHYSTRRSFAIYFFAFINALAAQAIQSTPAKANASTTIEWRENSQPVTHEHIQTERCDNSANKPSTIRDVNKEVAGLSAQEKHRGAGKSALEQFEGASYGFDIDQGEIRRDVYFTLAE